MLEGLNIDRNAGRQPQSLGLVLNLSERERLILMYIVHHFILTAQPVGSRALVRRYGLTLSAATIRNTMADLEALGLLTHPHTSAGRIPTDLGYRIYVDDLMHTEDIEPEIRNSISCTLQENCTEVTDVLDHVSELLGQVSRLLSVITTPDLSSGTLHKVEIVKLSADRIMIIIMVMSGMVETITLELKSQISSDDIKGATRFINQRLSGLKISSIPSTINSRLSGEGESRNAIVRLFLEFPERIFMPSTRQGMHIGGTRHVLDQPEYKTPEKFKGIIELVEDRDVIVHLLKDRQPGLEVTIGNEHDGEQLKDFSVITSTYRIGNTQGTLGIIGPTRMDYSKLITLVDYTSRLVSEHAEKGDKSNHA